MENCTCEDDSSKVCKHCFNTCKKDLAQCKKDLMLYKEQISHDLSKKEAILKEEHEQTTKNIHDLNSLKTQFYTVIGFLLIVTTSITSAVAFYSKEIPAIILENSTLKNNVLAPVLYFGAPMLLVFFTFFCSLWFYKSLSGSNAHPFWNALSLASKTMFYPIVNLSVFFILFSIFFSTFVFIAGKLPILKYVYVVAAVGIISITMYVYILNIIPKIFNKILKIIRKI